jgi:hypothetical protein
MNHQRRITLLTRVALPALAGCLVATLVIPRPATAHHNAAATSRQVVRERPDPEDARPLPDNPYAINLAAASGRTGEAKKRLADALASGAVDAILGYWLSSILIADPGWLEVFLPRVPEERRSGLVKATLRAMTDLQPDTVWTLLRKSPTALAVAKGTDPGHDPTLNFFDSIKYPLLRSSHAVDALFDPALGFSAAEAAEYLKTCIRSQGARILQEWQAGRWGPDIPPCVTMALEDMNREDPDAFRDMAGKLPPALQDLAENLDTRQQLWNSSRPDPEALADMEPAALKEFITSRSEAGRPLPLDVTLALPPASRREAVSDYMTYLYPGLADQAAETLSHLDDYPLTQGEKDTLLKNAAAGAWSQLSQIGTAMDYLSRIPDERSRTGMTQEILWEFAATDPQGALDYAAKMPEGKDRDFLIEKATAAQP